MLLVYSGRKDYTSESKADNRTTHHLIHHRSRIGIATLLIKNSRTHVDMQLTE
jgi:hypothetical protein